MSAQRVLLKSRDATLSSSSVREQYAFNMVDVKLQGTYKVACVSLCNIFYNVNSNNNTVYTSLGNATLTSGNYSASTFTTMLDTVLKVANVNFAATYNTDTKKITITNTAVFTLNFATTTNTAANLMGFAHANTASATSQVASYPVNLINTPSILLEFDSNSIEFQTANSASNNRGSVYLPLNGASYGTYYSWSYKDLPQHVIFQEPRNVIKVSIWDSLGNALSLQNTDLEIMLELISK